MTTRFKAEIEFTPSVIAQLDTIAFIHDISIEEAIVLAIRSTFRLITTEEDLND